MDLRNEEYNMANVTNPTICKTTTRAWCNRVNIFADLVSNGDISFNANVMTLGNVYFNVLTALLQEHFLPVIYNPNLM